MIVALMGVGLALDRPFSLRGWSSTWRLLLVAMPLFIAVLGLAAWGLAGLAPAAALLLAAVLAPTDPVLAADVRVGEPTDDPRSEDELRFALSSEAGANDGLAFPFVHASILLLTLPAAEWLGGWVAWELLGKVVLGVACGVAIGYVFAQVAFRAPMRVLRFAETAEAVVSLAAVFLAYGVTEMIGGYGFLSVFAAGLALRAQERGHEFHRTMHDFVTQVERLLTMGLLLVFGYSLGIGPAGRPDLAGRPAGPGGGPGHPPARRGRGHARVRRAGPGPAQHRLLRRARHRLVLLPGLRHGQRPVPGSRDAVVHGRLHSPRLGRGPRVDRGTRPAKDRPAHGEKDPRTRLDLAGVGHPRGTSGDIDVMVEFPVGTGSWRVGMGRGDGVGGLPGAVLQVRGQPIQGESAWNAVTPLTTHRRSAPRTPL